MDNTSFVDLNQVRLMMPPMSSDSMRGYQAISHISVIDNIKEELSKKNLSISKEIYKAGRYGRQLVGSILIDGEENNGIAPGVHFINSYDKSRRLQILSGCIVVICSNGLIRGQADYRDIRKHVGSISNDLDNMIYNAVNGLEEELRYFVNRKGELQTYDVSKRLQAELVGRLFMQEKIFTTTQLSAFKRITEDTKNIFNDKTSWDFYNNITEVLKLSHPIDYVQKHIAFDEFACNEFNIFT